MYACRSTFSASVSLLALIFCSSTRRRSRIITTLWKSDSSGSSFGCSAGSPGLSTATPPSHLGASGATPPPRSSSIASRIRSFSSSRVISTTPTGPSGTLVVACASGSRRGRSAFLANCSATGASVGRPLASGAPARGTYASQMGAVQGNSPRSTRMRQVPRRRPRSVSITRYTAQVPQIGPYTQTRPISLGSATQSSTSGQSARGGAGLWGTGSMEAAVRPRSGLASRTGVLDHAAHHRGGDGHLRQLVDGHLEHVALEHGEVRVVALADHAAPPLRMLRVRRAGGERAERLVARQSLLRHPGLAARGAPGHRAAQARPGIDALDGEVRSEGERRAGVHRLPPGIGAFLPLRPAPQPRFGPESVAGGVGRLHRGDRARGAQQVRVARPEELEVLDARPQRPQLGAARVGREHLRAGLVADGVHARLEPGGRHRRNPPRQFARLGQPQAGVTRVVLVRLEQLRAAAAQRAVGEHLHRAHRQPADLGSAPPRLHLRGELLHRLLPVEHRVHAHRQPILLGHLPVDLERVAVDARVVHGGEADGRQGLEPAEDQRLDVGRRGSRHRLEHGAHGVVDQDAGRVPRGIAHDQAALRVGRLPADPGPPQRQVVDPQRVRVAARQRHGIVRHRRAERGGGRESRLAPLVLLPSHAADPAARRHPRRRPGRARGALGLAGGAGTVHLAQRPAEELHVAVRVDQPGRGAASAQLDEPDRRRGALLALFPGAHAGESAAPDQCRLRARPRRVLRVQGPDDEQLVVHPRAVERPTDGVKRPPGYAPSVDRASHHLDTPLLVALAVSFVVGLVFWTAWPLWPFRLLVVLMHESGHAAATLLVGGSVERIQVRPDEAGVTLGRIVPSMWRQIVVSSAGYVGSTVSGCVLLWMAARSRAGRWPLLALAAWTGLVAILWVRDGFTLLFVGGAAFALGMVARYGPSLLRRALLVFLATFSVSYALYDIKDDLLHLASRGPSDAAALARLTFIPAVVWGAGWGLLSLGLVALTLRHILASGPPDALPTEPSGASAHPKSAAPPNTAATGPTEW